MTTQPTKTVPMKPGAPTGALKPEQREKLIADAQQRKAAAEAAEPKPDATPRSRVTAPWQDLEPTSAKPTAPRDKTVFSVALALISARPDGATLAEIKEAFRTLPGQGPDGTMYHHDPKTLLTWQARNRGWGFRMDPKTQRVTVWEK